MMFRQRMPYIRNMDDAAVSDDEETHASYGFVNMKLTAKVPSLVKDDMDVSG